MSCLTFKSFFYFEFIFVYGLKECSNFILLHATVWFSQHHLLKRLSFLPLYILAFIVIDSVQVSHSVMSDSATLWTAACQASLSIANSQSFLKFMSIELAMSSNHLILCHPLLLLPLIFSSIRVFSNESVLCIRWPKYWSFSFSLSPSNEYSGLISFRMDWVDLLA